MMNQLSLTTLILILLIGLSCARNEDTLKDYTVAGEKSGIDTTAPSESSITPSDSSSSQSLNPSFTITFSEAMDKASITTNTSSNECTGNVQISSDGFSNCLQLTSSTSSNSDKTSSFNSSSNLSIKTTYKIKISIGTKDIAGNSLSSQFETSSGFTTTGWKSLTDMTTGRESTCFSNNWK